MFLKISYIQQTFCLFQFLFSPKIYYKKQREELFAYDYFYLNIAC